MGSPRKTAKLFREVLPKAVRYPDGTIVLGRHNLKLYDLKGGGGEAVWSENFQEQDSYKFSDEADLIGWLSNTIGQIEQQVITRIGSALHPDRCLTNVDGVSLGWAFHAASGLGLNQAALVKALEPMLFTGVGWQEWDSTESVSRCRFAVQGAYHGIVEASGNTQGANEYEVRLEGEAPNNVHHQRMVETARPLTLEGLRRRAFLKYLGVVLPLAEKAPR
jgi:hypothetical protein